MFRNNDIFGFYFYHSNFVILNYFLFCHPDRKYSPFVILSEMKWSEGSHRRGITRDYGILPPLRRGQNDKEKIGGFRMTKDGLNDKKKALRNKKHLSNWNVSDKFSSLIWF